jgi:hypothetical protein
MPLPSWLEGKKLNKIEQNKANKDGLLVGSEIRNRGARIRIRSNLNRKGKNRRSK